MSLLRSISSSISNTKARIETTLVSPKSRPLVKNIGNLAFLADDNTDHWTKNQFFRYCCYEFSTDNYLAYVCMERYKIYPSHQKMVFLYYSFFSQEDERGYRAQTGNLFNRVNIEEKEAQAVWKNMLNVTDATVADVFTPVSQTVRLNLCDTISRFRIRDGHNGMGSKRNNTVAAILKTKRLLNEYTFNNTTLMGIY